MIKGLNISGKLKTTLLTLSILCFAAFAANAQTIEGNRIPQGNSAVFKTAIPSSGGSFSMDREIRQAKKALDKTTERLGTGAGVAMINPAAGVLYTAAPLMKYAGSLVGDGLGYALDGLDNLTNKGFKAFEDMVPEGLVKKLLVNYNPGYQILKFATKGAIKVAKFVTKAVFGMSNRSCNLERMNNIYKSGCYSCIVVKSLIEAFLKACSQVYEISKEAGVKILVLGLMLWIGFYVLQQISSLKNIEPTAMVNEMLIMAFKVLGAYLVITAGIGFFIDYVIVPFMNWGADFGLMLLLSSSAASGLDIVSTELDGSYLSTAETIIPPHLINNITTFVAAVDGTTSTHMQIGHMITCHSTNAGSFRFFGVFFIPNIWLWICGAAIWFAGFMMTLSVAYYLIDISFKLGFAIIAMPIVVGLWPFNVTKDRLSKCFNMVLNAAGIFVFLAMTTGAGLALVSNALDAGSDAELLQESAASRNIAVEELDGTQKLFLAVEDNDNDYIVNRFALFGPSFLLILFAYLYAIKLIGSTVSEYVDVFFPDGVMAGQSPMHHRLTQATDFVKKKAGKGVKFAKDVAKTQGKKATKGLASKFKGGGLKKFGKMKSSIDNISEGNLDKDKEKKQSKTDTAMQMTQMKGGDKEKMEKSNANGGAGQSTSGAGKAAGGGVKAGGQAMKAGGEVTEKAGEGMEQAGKGIDKAGQSGQQASKGVMKAGKAASATGIGAIVGVPLIAAGGAMYAGSTAVRLGGKAMEMSGKIVKKSGKVMKKVGEKLEKAGKKVEKVADKMEAKAKKIMNQAKSQMKGNKQNSEEKDENNNNSGNSDGRGNEAGQSDDLIGTMGKTTTGSKK